MDDIANHLMHALQGMDLEPDSTAPVTPMCGSDAEPWKHGAKLQNLILTVCSKHYVVIIWFVKCLDFNFDIFLIVSM